MNAIELRRKAAEKKEGLKTLLATAETEDRGLTEAEQTQFDTGVKEIESLEADAKRAENFAAIEARLNQPSGRKSDPLPHQDPTNTRGQKHEFSVLKAIREQINSRTGRGQGLSGLELETHIELEKRRLESGMKPAEGVLIPNDLAIRTDKRALDTTAGAGALQDATAIPLIEYLRNRLVLFSMGVRVLTDMNGEFHLPRQSGKSTFGMVGESSAVPSGNPTIDQISFTPHTGGGYVEYSRKFTLQTAVSAENFVREDLAKVVAEGIENQVFNGTGSSNQLTGLLANVNIPAVANGTDGGALTWAKLVEFESALTTTNADVGNLGFIVNSKTKGKLKTSLKVSGSTFPIYLWEGGQNPLNEYRAAVSNLLPSNLVKGSSGSTLSAVIFGNWNDLIIAFWSGLDVIVNPYALDTQGGVRVTAMQDFDANIRHNNSFAISKDVSTA